jgi:hypothetical protein
MQIPKSWLACLLVVAGCASKGATSGGPLAITPTQLYTGFDGATTFRIGAIATGATTVTWSLDDPTVADLQVSGQEVTLTTRRAGTTMLVVSDGSHRATVPLTVTSYTPEQHMTGRDRYTKGERGQRGDGGMVMIPDGGFDRGGGFEDRKPCTDCHGIARIEHGPNQCGWMTDDDLKGVILAGMRPDGTPVYDQDDSLSHHWRASDAASVVAYIRSLAVRGTPSQQ